MSINSSIERPGPEFSRRRLIPNLLAQAGRGALEMAAENPTLVALGIGALLLSKKADTALAVSFRQAGVRLSETTIFVTKDPSGNVISESTGVEPGNDYVISPTQERGRERMQRFLLRVGVDGVARERIKVMRKDGPHFWKDGGDTFVFNGVQDAEALVRLTCDPDPCKEAFLPQVLRPGMNLDFFGVRVGGRLEYLFTKASAFDCEPLNQKVIDKLVTQQARPTPIPPAQPTPEPIKPPVQVPVQLPRASSVPLGEEFGEAAYVSGDQLGRVIYE